MGPRNRAARRGPHHPHDPAHHRPVALPGQRARWPRQSPDRRPDGGGRRFAPPAIRTAIPSRLPRACGRGSRRRSTSAACARTKTGPFASTAASTSPRLGDSFDNVARYGLSFQRSQNSGRFTPGAGPNFGYYKRGRPWLVRPRAQGESRRRSTALGDVDRVGDWRGRQADRRCRRQGDGRLPHERSVGDRRRRWPQGLKLTREAMARQPRTSTRGSCSTIKERQFQDAINSALGMELTAVAQPAGVPEPTGPGAAFAPPAVMAAPVPGQIVRGARAAGEPRRDHGGDSAGGQRRDRHRGRSRLAGGAGSDDRGTNAAAASAGDGANDRDPGRHRGAQHQAVLLAQRAAGEPLHAERSQRSSASPSRTPPLRAVGRYFIDGVPIEIRDTVKRREAKLPYGEVLREVRSVPRIAVMLTPDARRSSLRRRPPSAWTSRCRCCTTPRPPTSGQVALRLPAGWTSEPASHPFSFARAGERAAYRFTVTAAHDSRPATTAVNIEAVATAAGQGVPRGLRAHRSSRSRGALPVSPGHRRRCAA